METDYWHSLDRKSPMRSINPSDIGISTNVTKKGLDQLKARVFEGASNVELGFMGIGKGSLGQGGTTPEMHTKEEREEIRMMAKVNEVDLTTHASVALNGLAGFEQGTFRPENREKAVHEINRTIDFAADVARGGPVVVHTGEFQRPLSEIQKMEVGGEEKPMFRGYPEEEGKAPEHLVDPKTGKLISELRRDIEIPVAEWKVKEVNGKPVEVNGKPIYLDEYGNELKGKDIFEKRVPKFDEDTGKVVVNMKKWGYFKKQADEWNKVHPEKNLTPGQWAFREQSESGIRQEKFSQSYSLDMHSQSKNQLDLLKKAEEKLKGIKDVKAGEDRGEQAKKLEIKKDVNPIFAQAGVKYTGDREAGIEIDPKNIEIRKAYLEGQVKHYKESVAGAAQKIEGIKDQRDRAETLEQYGVRQSADALARSAIHAFDKERSMKLDKPLFVAPENIFPEQFGSHPKELRTLVIESRKQMAKLLSDDKNRGLSKSEARKVADEHIKATFDIGHANTWKKFFVAKEGESPDQTDKRFTKWMGKQVETLQKEGIIGHVHISDNFGYYDEHLEPGGGNVPIKELADKLKKHGYKGKFIAEWGGQPEAQSFKVMTGAWKTLSSPVYKIDAGGMSWSDVEGSYFGRTGSPTYLVGDHAPSKDWTLWSETQLE